MSDILSFGDHDLSLEKFGGKAFTLSQLVQKGVPVPPGFAISSIHRLQFMSKGFFSDEFIGLVERKLKTLKTTEVIVRSSAFGEDGTETSLAGQLDSFVCKNDLSDCLKHIEKCWQSLHNARALQYKSAKDLSINDMGVVIQEFVTPRYAGVLFTTHPDGSAQFLVEYVEGHAEDLVQGKVTPTSLAFDPQDKLLPGAPFNLQELVDLSFKTKNIQNQIPQDIEWIDLDGKIYLVQARPITTLKRKIFWSNTNVNENFPTPLTPLQSSFARRGYTHYFKRRGESIGALPKDNSFNPTPLSNIIGFWGHRMYYNMSAIHQLIASTPLAGLIKTSFDHFVGFQGHTEIEGKKEKTLKKLKLIGHLILRTFKLKNHVKLFENRVSKFYELNLKAQHFSDHVVLYHRFLDIRFNQWLDASFADFFAMLFHGALGKVCLKLDPHQGHGHQNKLLQAIPGLVSHEPLQELWSMRTWIMQENLLETMKAYSSEEFLEELKCKSELSPLSKMVDSYLTRFGFRCSGELVLTQETYLDQPKDFAVMFLNYLRTPATDPQLQIKFQRKEQKKLLWKLSIKALKKRSLSLLTGLHILVPLATLGISSRERVRLKQAMAYHVMRRSLKKIGAEFVKRGWIETAKDVLFLEYEEISRLLHGECWEQGAYKELLSVRKNSFENATSYPEDFWTFDGDNKAHIKEEIHLNSNSLKGLPACGGKIKGKIKILDTVMDIHLLEKGDILVTKQTDPGWICAFPLISGLIVERGGMLSHGAIVAREFGIPAVVGVKDVTKRLTSGQTITLYGDQGVIECH
jgi:rifampicin phosphotransferase